MKIAILYENKFEEAVHTAHFLAHQVELNGNEVKIFEIGKFSPNKTLEFNPEVTFIVVSPHGCKWPCHFGKTDKYLKKMSKLLKNGNSPNLKKIGVFNCNEPENYTCKIKDRIRKNFLNLHHDFFPSVQTNYFRIFSVEHEKTKI